jgi:cobalt-zinc-cadmium efflux system outer membrane protein
MRTRTARTAVGLLVAASALTAPPDSLAQHPGHSAPETKGRATVMPDAPTSGPAARAATPAGLTLGALEQIALERNPTLAQAAALVDMSRAKAYQAGLHMNPVVGYEAEQLGLRGERASTKWGERQGVFIQQEIVTGGKLRLSRLKYQKEAFAAEIQAHAQRLRVVSGLQSGFFEVLAAERLVDIDRRALRNAEDALKTTAELVNVGQANEPDRLQAEIEVNRARVALKRAEATHRRAWEHLVTSVGAPELAVQALTGELEPAGPALGRDEALAVILRDSPEIQVAQAEVERDEVAVEREKREPIPNVIVRGASGYNFESRNVTTDVSVGFRLPVWDRNRGTIAQAEADLARARAEVARVELAVRRRFADTYQRYETARETVAVHRDQSLPKAKKALELYQDYFQKRRATWPQVLVAERTVTQLDEEYIEALLALRRAEVEIRGLLLAQEGGLGRPAGPTPQGHLEATPRPR